MPPDERADAGPPPLSAVPLTRPGGLPGRLFSRFPFALAAIILVALAARLVYLAEVIDSAEFNSLVLDAQWYHTEALRIGAEGWIPRAALFRAPGFPYLLALVYGLSGGSLLAARLVQIVLGSITAGLVLCLGWKLYGKWAGWIGGLLAATYGTFIYFSAEILGTALEVCTGLLALCLLVRAEGRESWRSWFLAGLGLGLSAIVRPTILVFGAGAVLWAKGRGSWRTGWNRAGALALGILLWVLPVTFLNYHASGEWVLIAHQGGVNYYIGNNPQADGKTAAGPGVKESDLLRSVGKTEDTVYLGAKLAAERATGRELRPSEVSRFWRDEALRFMVRHPGDWARLQARKLYYFWNGYEIDNNRDIGAFVESNSRLLRLPLPGFWLVGPLGLVGLVLSLRRGRASQLLVWFVIAQMIAVAAFFVCERFRMPAALALVVLASLSVVVLAGAIRRRRWRRWVPLVAGIVAFSWVVNTRALGITRDRDVAVHLYNQASAYMDQGLYDRAIDTLLRVLDVNPRDAKTYLSLGSAYLAKGLFDQAMPHYGRAVALDPSLEAPMHNDLGVYFILRGEPARAEEELLSSLEADPEYALARLNLAHVYRNTGRVDRALEEYRGILARTDVNPEQRSVAQTEIAMSEARAGHLGEAAGLLRQALRYDPANEVANLYLGQVLLESGDREGAVREWSRLLEEAADESMRAEAAARLREIGGGRAP